MNPANSCAIICLALLTGGTIIGLVLLTGGGVYWITSTHYKDLLDEKDANYWEHLGRAQTQGLHCEDQCKRLIDYSNNHYSALIAACDDKLKILLATDIQNTQKYQEMLSILSDGATLLTEKTAKCIHHCQNLHRSLENCNNSLTIQTHNIKRLLARSKQRPHTNKLFTECTSKEQESSSDTGWIVATAVLGAVVVCGCILTTEAGDNELHTQPQNNTKRNMAAIATEDEQEKQQLVVQKLIQESKEKDRQLQENNKKMTDLREESQYSQKMVDQLQEKLTKADNNLLAVKKNYEDEQREKAHLKEYLREKECSENESKNIIDQLKVKAEEDKTELSKQKHYYENEQQRLHQREKEMADQIEKQQREKAHLEKCLREKECSERENKKTIDKLEEELEELSKQRRDYINELKRLHQREKEKVDQIENLTRENQNLENELKLRHHLLESPTKDSETVTDQQEDEEASAVEFEEKSRKKRHSFRKLFTKKRTHTPDFPSNESIRMIMQKELESLKRELAHFADDNDKAKKELKMTNETLQIENEKLLREKEQLKLTIEGYASLRKKKNSADLQVQQRHSIPKCNSLLINI